MRRCPALGGRERISPATPFPGRAIRSRNSPVFSLAAAEAHGLSWSAAELTPPTRATDMTTSTTTTSTTPSTLHTPADLPRTTLYGDPAGRFVHHLILESCQKNAARTAIVDPSCNRRISYAEYGELVESMARGFVAAGLKPGDVVAIFLANSWEFCVAYHAATLA